MIARLIELPLDLMENKITISLPELKEEIDEKETGSESGSSIGSDISAEEDSDSGESSNSDLSDFETEETVASMPTRNRSATKREDKNLKVTIDLGLSAYANASHYFNIKKCNAEKQKKVEKNVEKAFKNIEEKVEKQLKQKLKESHSVLKEVRPLLF